MSSTRKNQTGDFKQEKFCSSAEFETGLLANLVARRCSVIENQADRELILWLQAESHKPGGLKAFVRRFIGFSSDKIGSELMLKLRAHSPGRVFDQAEVRAVRQELCGDSDDDLWLLSNRARAKRPSNWYSGPFPLPTDDTARYRFEKGERAFNRQSGYHEDVYHEVREADGTKHPDRYPAAAFLEFCKAQLTDLPERLSEYCLNPEAKLPAYAAFARLETALREYYECLRSAPRAGFAQTEVVRLVFRELAIGRRSRLVMIYGLEKMGKTTAAKEWCARNAGAARYVLVPATSDDISFYRAIAQAIGVSSALSLKGVQMRERIEQVMRETKLMLVVDAAENLWPQNNRREALPNRLNWLINALVEHGAPVALVCGPQFSQDKKIIERKTLWRSERFTSVLTHAKALPDTLSSDDLAALARAAVPEATEAGVAAIVEYAAASEKYISGIQAVASLAQFIAEENGRKTRTTGDIVAAIEENVLPSDRAVARDVQADCTRATRGRQMRATAPIRTDFVEFETGRNSKISARDSDLVTLRLEPHVAK